MNGQLAIDGQSIQAAGQHDMRFHQVQIVAGLHWG
jgi:hypothetical protein